MNIRVASVCDRGLSHKRPVNEDRALVLEERGLFVVCDGVGGHSSGEVASQLAVDTIEEALTHQEGGDLEELLQNAIRYANRDIFEMASSHARYEGMGTTVALLHVDAERRRAIIGHAGDSRVYRFDGHLHRETFDHTDLDDAIRAGRISPQQAIQLGKQNTINRALGIESEVQAEFKTISFDEGDAFLLCSDGVTRHIDDEELEDLFRKQLDPTQMCEEIRSRCYSRGAEDNLTAVVVHTAEPRASTKRTPQRIEFDRPPPRREPTGPLDRTRGPHRALLVLLVGALTAAAFVAGRSSVAWFVATPLPQPPAAAAREAFERGDLATARAGFAKLATEEPKRADYHYWLGRACLAQGEPREATTHLEESVRLDGSMRDTYLFLAAAYQSDNRPKEAAEALKKYSEAAVTPAQAATRAR